MSHNYWGALQALFNILVGDDECTQLKLLEMIHTFGRPIQYIGRLQ